MYFPLLVITFITSLLGTAFDEHCYATYVSFIQCLNAHICPPTAMCNLYGMFSAHAASSAARRGRTYNEESDGHESNVVVLVEL